MDFDLERIALGTVLGVTGATVAPGTDRESNQKINFGKKFDEIAGSNGACFHEVLMRVARVTGAHEYVHHVVNMNLSFFETASRAFSPHARAKKLPRAAERLVYSLTPSGVLAENHPKNWGFVGILRGQKVTVRRGPPCDL